MVEGAEASRSSNKQEADNLKIKPTGTRPGMGAPGGPILSTHCPYFTPHPGDPSPRRSGCIQVCVCLRGIVATVNWEAACPLTHRLFLSPLWVKTNTFLPYIPRGGGLNSG